MESVAKPISVESATPRDVGSAEYAEDLTEQENCPESCQHDSEYNTASDSTTSDAGNEKVNQKIEVIEISDDDVNDEDVQDEEDDEDEGSSLESGEEEEEDEENLTQMLESKRQVDDDEDRSNPQYIPKRGTFYEHDDRTAENADAEEAEAENEGDVSEKKVSFTSPAPATVKSTKKWQSSSDRWSHDRYDESEQAPKSKAELVSAYGYDIRNEESPPRARRRRRYGRGPSKYTRKWEDENAYSKAPTRRIALNSKDEFPEIDETPAQRSRRRGERKHEEEQHYGRGGYDDGYGRAAHENNQLKPKNQSAGFRVKSSIEFKNQNRMRQNSSGVEHNRQDSFIITRNNNAGQEGDSGQMEHKIVEEQSDFKGRHQPVHSLNGNEFAEFVPNYLHGQIPETQIRQINQPNVLLSHDMPMNYPGDSVKMIQRGHTATNTNIIPMANSDMRQTPKRYSSLRQRAVMGSGGQIVPPEMEQERLKATPADHHEIVESPKMKVRQQKSHHSLQQSIHAPTTPQSTNFYAPEYIRQPPLPAHRPTPPAAAKNHASLSGQAYQPQFAANTTGPAFVPPPAQTTPAFIAPPPQVTNPQQILNYVPPPTLVPPAPAQYPAHPSALPAHPSAHPAHPTFPNYQNYNSMTTPSIPHQSQGGITYYAPQTQQQPRAVVAQRRPTNAIPILAPPERSGNGKGRGRLPAGGQSDDGGEGGGGEGGKSNAESIDHILDNMFVRRTPYEPPAMKTSTSPPASPKADLSALGMEQTEEGIKNLSMFDQPPPPIEVTAKRTEESPSSGDQEEK